MRLTKNRKPTAYLDTANDRYVVESHLSTLGLDTAFWPFRNRSTTIRGLSTSTGAASDFYRVRAVGDTIVTQDFAAICSDNATQRIINPVFGGTYTGGVAQSWAAYSTGSASGSRSENAFTGYQDGQGQRISRDPVASADRWGVSLNLSAHTWTAASTFSWATWFYVHSYEPGAVVYMNVDYFDGGGFVTGTPRTLTLSALGWNKIEYEDDISGSGTATYAIVYLWIQGEAADLTFDTCDLFVGAVLRPHYSGADTAFSWVGTAYASTTTKAVTRRTYPWEGLLDPRQGTLGAWIYQADIYPGVTPRIFDHVGDGTQDIVRLYISAGTTIAGQAGEATPVVTSAGFANRTWTHAVLTWTEETNGLKLYVDGVLADQDTPSIRPSGNTIVDFDWGSVSGTVPFNGYLRDAFLSRRVYTAAEILDVYTNGFDETEFVDYVIE